jgi:hypothetical protein
MRRDDVTAIMSELESELVRSQAGVEAHDAAQYRALRTRHLLPALEVPLDASPPRTFRVAEVEAKLGPGAAQGIVSPGAIMHEVQHDALVRTGNLAVGSEPDDFKDTAARGGEPHHLASNRALAALVTSNADRFTKTTGGFGPAFHRTGAVGLVDIPTSSGKSGVQVEVRPSLVHPNKARGGAAAASAAPAGGRGPSGAASGAAGTVDRKRAVARSVSFGAGTRGGSRGASAGGAGGVDDAVDAFDRELARSAAADEPYAEAVFEDPTAAAAAAAAHAGGLTAAQRRENAAAAVLASVPDGVAGTRGEGMASALARSGALEYARRHAGAGTAGALSLNDIAENSSTVDRMRRPQRFLKNPRHLKADKTSLLLAGAGSGMRHAGPGGLPPTTIEALPPGTARVSPVRAKSGGADDGGRRSTSPVQFQTVGGDAGGGSVSPARTGTIGLAAALGQRKTAFLPSRGAPLPSTLLTDKGLRVTSESLAGTFVVRPAAVDFRDYEGGTALTATITVQNVDSLSRHLRVLPPSTRVFTIDIPQFPGALGPGGLTTGVGVANTLGPTGPATSAVAPGMAVKIHVTFRPPTAAPYEDEVTLVTEAGTFTVPLRGSLPVPELSLPLSVYAGTSLQYDVHRVRIPVTNIGARARFRILPEEIFDLAPAHALSVAASLPPGSVPGLPSDVYLTPLRAFLGPFALSPTSFELGRGETGELILLFAPQRVGPVRRSFVVVTSDGSVYTHSLEADCSALRVGLSALDAAPVPRPLLTGVDPARPEAAAEKRTGFVPPAPADVVPGSLLSSLVAAAAAALGGGGVSLRLGSGPSSSSPSPIPSPAQNPPSRMRFDDIFPGTRQTRTVVVRNDTALPIRFSWTLEGWDRMAPQLALPTYDEEDTRADVRKSRALLGRERPTLPESHQDFADAVQAEEEERLRRKSVPIPFTISPMHGELTPAGETVFTLSFAPWAAGVAEALAVLDVHDVPVDPRVAAEMDRAAAEMEAAARAASEESSGATTLRLAAAAAAAAAAPARRKSKPGDWTPEATSRAATPTEKRGRAAAAVVSATEEKKDEGGVLAGAAAALEQQQQLQDDDADVLGSHGGYSSAEVIAVTVSHAADAAVRRQSLTVGKLLMQGAGRPADVVLDSPCVSLPGPLLPGHASSHTVRLVNRGDAPVHFAFPNPRLVIPPGGGRAASGVLAQPSDEEEDAAGGLGSSFTVTPSHGFLPGRGEAQVTVTFSASEPGAFAADLDCAIFQSAYAPGGGNGGADAAALLAAESTPGARAGSLRVRASASVRCPEVRFAEPLIDVGLLGCERTVRTKVRLVNTSDAPARYVIARVRGPGSPDVVLPTTKSPRPASRAGGARVTATDVMTDVTGAAEVQPLDPESLVVNLGAEPSTGVLAPRADLEVEVLLETGSKPERFRAYLRVAVIPLDSGAAAAESAGSDTESGAAYNPSSSSSSSSARKSTTAASGTKATGKKDDAAEAPVPISWPGLPSHLLAPPSYIRLVGEIQSPRVVLSAHSMSLGVVFLGIPVRHSVTITNACNLEVEYRLDPYVGALAPPQLAVNGRLQAPAGGAAAARKKMKRPGDPMREAVPSKFQLDFEPGTAGTLGPKESRTITLVFTPRLVGKVAGALFACDVVGMPHPLGVSVDMLVKGVTVAYALVDDATGLVLRPPPAPAAAAAVAASSASAAETGDSSSSSSSDDLEKHFAESMANVDESLRHDPVVRQILDAYERAGELGATLDRVPDIVFGTAGGPLPLLTRRSVSLHILNLSGIPTAVNASAANFPAHDPVAAQDPGSAVNWPALYYAADSISAGDAATIAAKKYRGGGGGAAAGSGAVAAKSSILSSTVSFAEGGPSVGSLPGGSVLSSTVGASPPSSPARESTGAGAGGSASSSSSRSLSPQRSFRMARVLRYGPQTVSRRLGEDPGSSSASVLGSLDAGGFGSTMSSAFVGGGGGAGAHASSSTMRSRGTTVRTGGGSRSTSPTRRPKWFLTDATEGVSRFQSAGGRAYLATAEYLKVMRQSLAQARCAAVEVYPPLCVLPAFGHVAIQVGFVADMPGSYSDTLRLALEGAPDVAVPVRAVVEGNPLSLVTTGTVGLQVHGACGATGPTVNFGDQPEYSPSQSKAVTVENQGPMDAYLTWHTIHDRFPGAPHPEVSVDITATEEEDEEAEGGGKVGEEAAETGGPAVRVVVRPFSDRVDMPPPSGEASAATPPPFTLTPGTILVPAYGRATMHVTATPTPVSAANRALAEELGWPAELRQHARARFAADAVFVPRGAPAPRALLDRAARPITPPDVVPPNPSSSSSSSSSATALVALDDAAPGDGASLLRDALTVHGVIRPFRPLLQLDRAVLSDGKPHIAFSVWSTALEAAAVAHAQGGAAGAPAHTSSSSSSASGAFHPSCKRSFTLANLAGNDLVFTLRVEGPFLLTGAHTTAPKHPITRVDVLAKATSKGPGAAPSATLGASLAALFAPGALETPDGSVPKIHSLPPQTNLTVDVAFDPSAGASLRTTAAALYFSDRVPIPSNALTNSVRLPGGGMLAETAGGGGGGGLGGTITLGATGGAAGADAAPGAGGVNSVVTASVTRLKGEYAGTLVVTFANGATQEIGLRADVLRPAVAATPAAHTFGVVRVEEAGTTTIHLGNPTTVDAAWALRHVPAPPGRPPRPGEAVDWRSLGLDDDPLWAPKGTDPAHIPVDDPAVFAFSAVSGSLRGPTAPLDAAAAKALRATDPLPQPLPLQVRFSPREAVLYQSRFRVSVRQGESFEIVLRGRGTFEENGAVGGGRGGGPR